MATEIIPVAIFFITKKTNYKINYIFVEDVKAKRINVIIKSVVRSDLLKKSKQTVQIYF